MNKQIKIWLWTSIQWDVTIWTVVHKLEYILNSYTTVYYTIYILVLCSTAAFQFDRPNHNLWIPSLDQRLSLDIRLGQTVSSSTPACRWHFQIWSPKWSRHRRPPLSWPDSTGASWPVQRTHKPHCGLTHMYACNMYRGHHASPHFTIVIYRRTNRPNHWIQLIKKQCAIERKGCSPLRDNVPNRSANNSREQAPIVVSWGWVSRHDLAARWFVSNMLIIIGMSSVGGAETEISNYAGNVQWDLRSSTNN